MKTKKNYKTVPKQNTKLGKWLNVQMTNKITGTRGKVKKYLHPIREMLLGDVLKKSGIEWEWEKQKDRESIQKTIELWKELKEWESKQGVKKSTEKEQKRNSFIRQQIAQTRHRSKKWFKSKDKWKVEMLIKEGFPLPIRNNNI